MYLQIIFKCILSKVNTGFIRQAQVMNTDNVGLIKLFMPLIDESLSVMCPLPIKTIQSVHITNLL